MKYFDGRKIRDEIVGDLAKEVKELNLRPVLAVIWVGDDFATTRYIEAKQRVAEKIGVHFDLVKYSNKADEKEIVQKIESLNKKDYVDGIMIQIPVPNNINVERLIETIDPKKDVDALRFCANYGCPFQPPVTMSILEAVRLSGIDYKKSKITVIGKGFLVGAPIVKIFDQVGAEVRIGDRNTPYLGTLTKDADIIISATGKANLIRAKMVKEGAVLIDAGTTEVGGKLAGDIEKNAYKKAGYYTPVPGGIGPVTVAMLLKNVVEAAKKNKDRDR